MKNQLLLVKGRKQLILLKKLWLCRLFQKKHTILVVDVFDKNPYVNTDYIRFIEILK